MPDLGYDPGRMVPDGIVAENNEQIWLRLRRELLSHLLSLGGDSLPVNRRAVIRVVGLRVAPIVSAIRQGFPSNSTLTKRSAAPQPSLIRMDLDLR
jgi:hypothetical protein